MEAGTLSKYTPPATDPHKEWSRYQAADFAPTERQKDLIAVIQSALDAKLFYTSEVLVHCRTVLGLSTEQVAAGGSYVEGGWFGMDCYYARGYIQARASIDAESKAWARLAPQVGDHLGTLTFSDYKRNTGMVIVAVLDGGVKLTGKRGASTVSLEATATQIGNAMDLAAERGHRKTGFVAYSR